MGNETFYNYLMGRALDSQQFAEAKADAPLEVLNRAYTEISECASSGRMEEYTGRLICIHKAILSRIMEMRLTREKNRERLAEAVKKATAQSMNSALPIFVYLRGDVIGQSETMPTDAGMVIKCQNGHRYGYHAPRPEKGQAYG